MPAQRSPPQQSRKGGSAKQLSPTTSNTSLASTASQSRSLSTSAATTPSGASAPLKLTAATQSAGSTLTLQSRGSAGPLLAAGSCDKAAPHYHQYAHNAHHHHHHHHQHAHQQQPHHHYRSSVSSLSSTGGSGSSSLAASSMASMKRAGKKHNWGSRERAGMSFLIVIAFFAIFGLIILTEVFMIDERSHGGMVMLVHDNGYGGRMGDSQPDYDNVKDDYDQLDENLLGDNKLGFVQFRDNKLKIQGADTGEMAGRLAGVLLSPANGANGFPGGGGVGAGGPGSRFRGDVLSARSVGLSAAAGLGAALSMVPWGKWLSENDEKTLPPYPSGTRPTDGSWQVVNGTRFKFFVFSAFFDRRQGSRLVRVVGATKTRGPERVWCRFWYKHNATSQSGAAKERSRYTSATVMARVKVIRENWNLKYSACFVLCPVRLPELDVPQFVSVVSRLRAPPGNLLELRNTDSDPDFAAGQTDANATVAAALKRLPFRLPQGDQLADKIAICVKPFHFNYDQSLYLMEYIEFYAILGVSHFTFYNHTIGPRASCVLRHYMNGQIPANLSTYDDPFMNAAAGTATADVSPTGGPTGGRERATDKRQRYDGAKYTKPSVQILPWNLRMRSQKEIRTEGLFAALNDCLYRTMYRYKYLALVDLDEFIVPRQTDTLNELINSLNRRFRNRNTGAYSFQNGFFYLQFADDALAHQTTGLHQPEYARLRAALVTQRKTKRRFKLHPHKQRSKYICKPEAVVEAGNHFVWEYAPGRGSLNVPPTEAILQHYRVCEFGGNDCIKAPSVNDRTATKYVNRLVQRIAAVYAHLQKPCDLPDLPPLPPQTEAELRQQRVQNEQRQAPQVKLAAKQALPATQSTQAAAKTTPRPKSEAAVKLNSAAVAASTITTITTATTTPTPTSSKNKSETSKPAAANRTTREPTAAVAAATAAKPSPASSVRKKRKFVVFEKDEQGLDVARLECL